MPDEKRGVGRPSNPNRKQRINVTLSPETLYELEQCVPLKGRSAYIERLIRKDLRMEVPQEQLLAYVDMAIEALDKERVSTTYDIQEWLRVQKHIYESIEHIKMASDIVLDLKMKETE